MIKHMVSGLALSLVLASTALAQAPAPAAPTAPPATSAPAAAPVPEAPATAAAPVAPGSLDDCIAAASSLGQMAESKTLAEDKLDKLDELFTKMETLCDAKNFTEAASVAKDIKTMLDGQ